MLGRWKQAGVAIVCASMLLGGCSLVSNGEDLKPELLKPVKTSVDLIEVTKGTIANEINSTAVVVPRSTTFAEFTIDGSLGRLYAKAGDVVKKGDLLADLAPGTVEKDILNQTVKLETVKGDYDKAKASNDMDKIRIAAMSVDAEQLRLDGYMQKRDNMKLYAPVSGIVDFIEPGLAPNVAVTAYRDLIGIIDPNDLQVKYIAGSSTGINEITLGMPVNLTFKGKAYTGKVTQIPATAPPSVSSIQAEKNTRTLMFDFDQMPSDIAYGDTVVFNMVLDRKDNVITIPRVALRTYQGRDFVHVMEGESRREVDVEKGLVSATQVEITKGLKEGMKIVLNN